jgi:hypothetical protein
MHIRLCLEDLKKTYIRGLGSDGDDDIKIGHQEAVHEDMNCIRLAHD